MLTLLGFFGRKRKRNLNIQKTDVKIDQEKMASEVKYDGKYVLRTNTKLTNREVAQSYKLLWKVERAFRELKSGLDLRPIYHYTDTRVMFLATSKYSTWPDKNPEPGINCLASNVRVLQSVTSSCENDQMTMMN